MRTLIFVLSFLAFKISYCGEADSLLNTYLDAYLGLEDFEVRFQMTSGDTLDHESGLVFDHHIIKRGTSIFVAQDNFEILQNDRYYIYVNHLVKKVIAEPVASASTGPLSSGTASVLAALELIYKDTTKVRYYQSGDSNIAFELCYDISRPSVMFNKIILTFEVSGELKEVKYYHRAEDRVSRYAYSLLSDGALASAAYLEESRYLAPGGGLQSAWHGYTLEIIDNE